MMNNNTLLITCAKIYIHVLNLLLAIQAIAAIYLGAKHSSMNVGVYSIEQGTEATLIGGGVILLVLLLLGLLGIIKEQCILIKIYACSILVLSVLVIIAAIIFICMDLDSFKANMLSSTYRYDTDPEWKSTWDAIHEAYDCCGVDGPTDWNVADGIIIVDYPYTYVVPNSCCVATETCSAFNGPINTKGCWDDYKSVISSSITSAGLGALAIGILEFIGGIMAFILSARITANRLVKRQAQTLMMYNSINGVRSAPLAVKY